MRVEVLYEDRLEEYQCSSIEEGILNMLLLKETNDGDEVLLTPEKLVRLKVFYD
jgi:hypothetical protein